MSSAGQQQHQGQLRQPRVELDPAADHRVRGAVRVEDAAAARAVEQLPADRPLQADVARPGEELVLDQRVERVGGTGQHEDRGEQRQREPAVAPVGRAAGRAGAPPAGTAAPSPSVSTAMAMHAALAAAPSRLRRGAAAKRNAASSHGVTRLSSRAARVKYTDSGLSANSSTASDGGHAAEPQPTGERVEQHDGDELADEHELADRRRPRRAPGRMRRSATSSPRSGSSRAAGGRTSTCSG